MSDLNDLDDQYRRLSALDASRPSEEARRNILAHAAQLAAGHRAKQSRASDRRGSARRRWKPAILGSLLAAGLAGLLITPRFLNDTLPPRPSAPIPSIAMNEPVPVEPPSVQADSAATTDRLAQGSAKTAAPARQRPPSIEAARPRAAESIANYAQSARVAPPPVEQSRDAAAAPSLPAVLDAGTMLRRAAESGDIATLQSLLNEPVDLASRDNDGRTALMLAAIHGQSEAVNVLLAHGADPNAADAQGITPSQAAAKRNYRTIIDALSRAGAH
jgi:hypothetical protein